MSTETDLIEKVMSNFATLSDLTLVAGIDQEKFPVVRKLIAKSSKFFEALVGPNFKEGAEEEIVLKSVDGPTLKAVICYIYSGRVKLTSNNIGCMLDAAAGMQLLSLEEKCGQYLEDTLTEENCLDTLLLADKYSLDKVKNSALTQVGAHFEKIPRADILQIDGNLLLDLFKFEHFEAPESKIFECLVEWVQHNETKRAQFMPDLLKTIHLEYMPGEFLCTNVKPIFEQYGLSELVWDECQKRSLEFKPNRSYRCTQSMSKNIYYADFLSSTIKISKFSSQSGWSTIKIVTHDFPQSLYGWAFCGEHLYILGGYSSSICLDSVETYEMNTWYRKISKKMLTARRSFNPVVSGKYIYIFGGYNYSGAMCECERFDTERNEWKTLSSMPKRLSNAMGIEINGNFYIAGGFEYGSNPSNAILCFQPNTNRWTEKTYLNGEIRNIQLSKSNELLYVVVNTRRLHTYDTVKDLWLEIRPLSPITILKTVDYFGQVYALYFEVVGGGPVTVRKFGKILLHDDCKTEAPVDVPDGVFGLEGFLFVF